VPELQYLDSLLCLLQYINDHIYALFFPSGQTEAYIESSSEFFAYLLRLQITVFAKVFKKLVNTDKIRNGIISVEEL